MMDSRAAVRPLVHRREDQGRRVFRAALVGVYPRRRNISASLPTAAACMHIRQRAIASQPASFPLCARFISRAWTDIRLKEYVGRVRHFGGLRSLRRSLDEVAWPRRI